MSKHLEPSWLATQTEHFAEDRANRVARNAVTANNVLLAARDASKLRSYRDTYGIQVPKTAEVTNQRHSGRCWMFSAFNIFRHSTMELLDVDSFEFSQSYGMFYDKLEKANSTLEYVIELRDEPWDSRKLTWVLCENMGDGGYFPFAINLIKKYGLVPKSVMPETAASQDSSEMDTQLERHIRHAALDIRKAHAKGASLDELRAIKERYLKDIHRMLAICLGEPPLSFDFIYEVGKKHKLDKSLVSAQLPGKAADEEGKKDETLILRDYGLTPLDFLKKYVGLNPDNFISLVYMPGADRPFMKGYHLNYVDSVLGGQKLISYNVEKEILHQAAIASLKAGIPVGMACDVMQQYPRHIKDFNYILSTEALDMQALFNIDNEMSREDMLDAHETCLTHAMCFQGVELDEQEKPKAWRVENSWGKDAAKDGYLICDAQWFDTYGGEIDVYRDFVPQEILAELDKAEIIEVDPWSSLASGFSKKLH